MSYKLVELSEGEPVQYVGTYVTQWPHESGAVPTVGFIECESIDIEEIIEKARINLLRKTYDMKYAEARGYELALRDMADEL